MTEQYEILRQEIFTKLAAEVGPERADARLDMVQATMRLVVNADKQIGMRLPELFPATVAAYRLQRVAAWELARLLIETTMTETEYEASRDRVRQAAAGAVSAFEREGSRSFEETLREAGAVQVGVGPDGPIYHAPNLN